MVYQENDYSDTGSFGQNGMILGNPGDDNLHKWRLDASEIIERITYELKGYVWDNEIKKYTKAGKPEMGDELIRQIILTLETYLNPITLTTDLDEQSISRLVIGLGFTLTKMFGLYAQEYELDRKKREIILKRILDQVYFALRKSKGAGERESITGSYRLSETGQEHQGKSKIW